jgi:hypothetical protein
MVEAHPLFDAIGRVVTRAAHMEIAYGALVAQMAGGELAHAFTVAAGPASLATAANLLLDTAQIAEPWRQRCRDTLKRARELGEDRNHVVHGLWLPEWVDENEQKFYASIRPTRKSFAGQSRDWTLTELHDLAHAMRVTYGRLSILTWHLAGVQRGDPDVDYWPESDDFFDGLRAAEPGHG